MRQCVVIADDLAGANTVGVMLRKKGLESFTLIGSLQASASLPNADCLAVSVESRGLSSKAGYERVFRATQILASPTVRLYAKYMEPSLRGNIGREIDAMLDALDNGSIAIVAPCHPASKRVLVGGHLLVDGVPLHKTEFARDPKCPVFTSNTVALLRLQSRYPVENIPIGALETCSERLGAEIARLAREGVRILVVDCVTEDDLDLIANAALACGHPFIAVDPGFFTARLAQKLFPRISCSEKRVLVAIGSVHERARAQVETFLARRDVYCVYVDTAKLLAGEERRESEIDRVCAEIASHPRASACGFVCDGIFPDRQLPLAQPKPFVSDAPSGLIDRSFAEIAMRVLLEDPSFSAIYTCGGDTSVAICERLGASGIRVMGEAVPLASFGTLVGGDFAGLPIICKGGTVGDDNALSVCVDHLLSL